MKFGFLGEIWNLDDRCVGQQGSFDPDISKGLMLDDTPTTLYIRGVTKNFKDEVFLDIGANFGTMSLASQCKTYCFEPCKTTYELLKSNIELNPNKDITPICEAVSDVEEDYHVHIHEGGYCGLNHILPGGHRKTITIDKWAKENNIKNIKLIKIDTEGHDSRVIRGAQEIIKRDKPLIITESYDKKILDLIKYKFVGVVLINYILAPK